MNRVSVVYRPQLEVLANLLDVGDLGRHYGDIKRWIVFSRIAIDNVGNIEEGARAAWNRFIELLAKEDEAAGVIYPQNLDSYTWALAGAVLARQPQPTEAFRKLFDDLLLERERVRMGVRVGRNGSDLPLHPFRSQVAVVAGVYALLQDPVRHEPASMHSAVFSALREMWLNTESSEETLWLVRQMYLHGALAHRGLPSATSAAIALHEELVDALRHLAPDPHLVCEVAELWLKADCSADTVVEAFARAGIDVHRTYDALVEEPNTWRSGSGDLQFLGQALRAKHGARRT